MKQVSFRFFFYSALAILFTSCSWLNSDETVQSSDPAFYSLKFAKNDSVPGLSTASFKVVYDPVSIDGKQYDSVIVNVDSLPFNTNIKKVIPTFTWNSSGGAYLITNDSITGLINDTIAITGTDTVNFNRVVLVKNFAASGDVSRVYAMKVNVHKVEPDEYVWKKVTDDIYSHSGSVQKAVYFKNKIFFYVASSVRNYLYTSTDTKTWENKSDQISGLPINSLLRNMVEFNGKLYVLSEDDKVYSTADGYNWTGVNGDLSASGYLFQGLLYSFQNKIWAIVKATADNTYRFANSSDGVNWIIYGQIPAKFPVGDFTALSFTARNKQSKVLVAGGYSTTGMIQKNVWSSENGSYWVDFSTENTSFGNRSGVSIINYNNKLLLFGGVTEDGYLADSTYLESLDDGLSWGVPDTTYNYLRERHIMIKNGVADTTYTYYDSRAYQSVIQIAKSNSVGTTDYYIYLIGGVNPRGPKIYKDVWVGKLNKLSFLIEEDN